MFPFFSWCTQRRTIVVDLYPRHRCLYAQSPIVCSSQPLEWPQPRYSRIFSGRYFCVWRTCQLLLVFVPMRLVSGRILCPPRVVVSAHGQYSLKILVPFLLDMTQPALELGQSDVLYVDLPLLGEGRTRQDGREASQKCYPSQFVHVGSCGFAVVFLQFPHLSHRLSHRCKLPPCKVVCIEST